MAKALLYLVIAHLIFIQMYLFQSVNLNRDILIEWLGDKINSDEINLSGKNIGSVEAQTFNGLVNLQAKDLPVYLESYFTDAFGDNGTLQRMKDLESRPLDDMAQHQHKATKLELSWGSDETTKAHAIAVSLQGKLRDRKEDPADAAEITKKEYLEWITYETRYRLCSDQRPPPSQAGGKKGATNNLLVVSLSCT